jgi:hypothetical protein
MITKKVNGKFETFTPFDENWKKEMMELNKGEILFIFRAVALKNMELKLENKRLQVQIELMTSNSISGEENERQQ